MDHISKDSLQAYFEQQNDKEAASIVAAVIALLPSNTSWDEEEQENIQQDDLINGDNVLNNILLTKESEIAALKEVIYKWRTRALEAEANARAYFSDQLKMVKLQHENELKSMESRYTRKLYEQEDIISNLNDQVDYLIMQQQKNKYYRQHGDTDSFVSTIDYDEDDEYDDDTRSIASSYYDRDVEQGLVSTHTFQSELKESQSSEAILDNIQVTLRAIENELSFHTHEDEDEDEENDYDTSSDFKPELTRTSPVHHMRRHRRSPTFNSSNTYFSSATLIDPETSIHNNKKIRKSSFFINRIFKKAFPKLYKKHNIKSANDNNSMNLKYTKAHRYGSNSSIHFDQDSSGFPRSSTDETLGVYSTTTTATSYQKPVNVLDILPAMNNSNPIQV